jgi:diguanylate cyclase (GGDEF)-like protein
MKQIIFGAIKRFMHSKILLLSGGTILTVLIGYIDYITGHETSLSLLYLIPILLVTSGLGKTSGILMGMIEGIVWTGTNIPPNVKFHLYHPFYWELLGNILICIAFAYLIYKLKKAFDREKEYARKDFVTGINNRKSFSEITQREVDRTRRYGGSFTVVYADCDNFKTINDTMGHDAGDKCLRLIAKSIEDDIREVDLVARLGGDEFAILLPATGSESAKKFIERLLKGLAETTKTNKIPVTFSMGAVTFLTAPESVENVIKRSDALMYEVKKEGKNNVKYETFREERRRTDIVKKEDS